jgi:ribosomal protein L11 methyltransferase
MKPRRIKKQSLWSIAVKVPGDAEEAVVDLFTRLFGQPASSYIALESNVATVTIYFEKKPKISATQRAELTAAFKRIRQCGLPIGRPKPTVTKLPPQDWAESWKRHFHPIEIGSRLLIKPGWIKRRPRKGQATIILDPGLSFGTGQHPTTAFCLRELVTRRKPGTKQAFLDIGTGSGILAIAAARLGYAPVDAFDFDPVAVDIAANNAKRNRVLHKINLFEHDVTRLPRTGARYSVICANLISNLLLSARERILARLAPDGVLIVAGILKTEFHFVQGAYQQAGLRLVASHARNEWRSGTFAAQ